MPAPSGFRFLDLPAELRTNILSQLVISECGTILHNRTLFGSSTLNHVTILYIFLVNVQIYQEASAIFYGQNRFILNAQSHRLPIHLTKTGGFLSQEGQDARRRVQTMTLYLTRIGGEFEDILAPTISDMVLNGSLRQLRICVGPPSSHNFKPSDSDMITRPPFQTLLRLLADPDLHHVELFVWKVHWNIFCSFHGNGTVTSEEKTTESMGATCLTTGQDNSGWVSLDWQAMVDVLGTGQRILKIGERGF
ncbi:hypothetical protein F5Y19DRAFT_99086 [Xylariaceae sp. FL1651]|nr:hypothetical protein F5Y19DRAFT_99086 [Xylariaceae sp. FL1651]